MQLLIRLIAKRLSEARAKVRPCGLDARLVEARGQREGGDLATLRAPTDRMLANAEIRDSHGRSFDNSRVAFLESLGHSQRREKAEECELHVSCFHCQLGDFCSAHLVCGMHSETSANSSRL